MIASHCICVHYTLKKISHSPSSRPVDSPCAKEFCLPANAIGLDVIFKEIILLSDLRAGAYFGRGRYPSII